MAEQVKALFAAAPEIINQSRRVRVLLDIERSRVDCELALLQIPAARNERGVEITVAMVEVEPDRRLVSLVQNWFKLRRRDVRPLSAVGDCVDRRLPSFAVGQLSS